MIEEIEAPAPTGPHPAIRLNAGALIATPVSATCTACVVIPARDEAPSIERTLAALAAQIDLDGRPVDHRSFEVLLLANNCRDETAAVALHWAEQHRSVTLYVLALDLTAELAHVGYARRVAMDEACRRLLVAGRPRGVIVTTDADTAVAPTWLAATLREVSLGADAIGGRILVAAHERQQMALPARSRFLRNVGFGSLANEASARIDPRPGDPWPCHEQFSGASLAITAWAYRKVGGLPPLSSGEDSALADALRRADIEIRHSPSVRVHTSGRLDGRTPAGLAASLAAWSNLTLDGQFQLVPSAASVVARATGRRALRDLWRQTRISTEICAREIAVLADFAEVSEAWLCSAVLDTERFGVLWEGFEEQARWRRSPVLVDVRDAIAGLRLWLGPYRHAGAAPPSFARHVSGLPYILPTRRAALLAVPARDGSASAPLEEIETVAALAVPLAPPPQVA